MRDPERIDKICDQIRDLWNLYPDLRLGQLLSCFIFHNADIFNQEDSETSRMLHINYIAELKRLKKMRRPDAL